MALAHTAAPPRTTAAPASAASAARDLPLPLLIALVVGSMIGSGIFALPQNTAAGAGSQAVRMRFTSAAVRQGTSPGTVRTTVAPRARVLMSTS